MFSMVGGRGKRRYIFFFTYSSLFVPLMVHIKLEKKKNDKEKVIDSVRERDVSSVRSFISMSTLKRNNQNI
jgi:hypothetical protein